MHWFRDRKTVTKLMLAFGLLAALMCVLGLEGIRNVSVLNARTRDMYEHHVLGLNYLKDGHLQLTTAGKSIRNAMGRPLTRTWKFVLRSCIGTGTHSWRTWTRFKSAWWWTP
jgi:hypothetical protein